MDKINLDGIEIKIPNVARGAVIPHELQRLELEKAKLAAEKKSDRRHDWAVAVVSALVGAIAGGLVGYITALITLKAGL